MSGKMIISFLAGSAVGGSIAWFFTRRYFKARNEEDVESFRNKVRELQKEYPKKEENAQDDQTDPAEVVKKGDELVESVLEGAKAILEKHKYVNYSDVDDGRAKDESGNPMNKEDMKKRIDIEKITEDIFNEPNSKFEKCGITYYKDEVFTDDADKEMSEGYLSETIGIDIRDEVIETKDVGTLYVRNHKTGRDYEILLLDETWSDVHEVD